MKLRDKTKFDSKIKFIWHLFLRDKITQDSSRENIERKLSKVRVEDHFLGEAAIYFRIYERYTVQYPMALLRRRIRVPRILQT